mgnify:CR=1 FL=1
MSDAAEPRPDLATLGTLEYDGASFGNGTRTLSVTINPVRNAADNAVSYLKYVFSFETRLGGGPTDEPVTQFRQRLMKPGKAFKFEDRGLGSSFSINVSGGSKDVMYGPRPSEVSFRPLGGGNGCVITWRVEVHKVDCSDGADELAIMDHGTTVSDEISESGHVTRKVTGYVRVPNRLIGDGTRLNDSPDYYRDQVIPPLVPETRRTFGPFTVNPARTQLDYSYTDSPTGRNIPPPGVVKITADQVVTSSVAGLSVWQGTIQAEYLMAANVTDVRVAVEHFFLKLVQSRVDALAKSLGGTSRSITPAGLTLREPDIFGPDLRAGFTFTFMFNRNLKNTLGTNGLWTPIPGSDWRKWATSLASSAFNPRGASGAVIDIGDDRVVTLCKPSSGRIGGTTGFVNELRNLPLGGFMSVQKLVDAAAPPPELETSWLYYQNEVVYEADTGSIISRVLPKSVLTAATDVLGKVEDAIGEAYDAIKSPGKYVLGAVGQDPAGGSAIGGVFNPGPGGNNRLDNVQSGDASRRVRPAEYVFLVGKAARAGHPVPRPTLSNIGGVEPVPADRLDRGEGFGQQVIFGAGSTPIYAARWRLRYYLPAGRKEGVAVPSNPIFDPPKS